MVEHIDANKWIGSNTSWGCSYTRNCRGETDADQIAGSSISAVISIHRSILADWRRRISATAATKGRPWSEALVTGCTALRRNQQVHRACGTRGVGCGLCRLAMKPHVRKVEREAEPAQKEDAEDKHDKQRRLAGFARSTALASKSQEMLGHASLLSNKRFLPAQFIILPSAAALTVSVGHPRLKNGR